MCVCVLQKREIYWESTGKQEHKDRINKLNIQVFDWQENDIFTFPVVVYIFAPYPDTYDTDKNTSIYIFVQNVVFSPLTLIVQRQSCIFLKTFLFDLSTGALPNPWHRQLTTAGETPTKKGL